MTFSGGVFFDRDGILIESLVENGLPVADNDLQRLRFVLGALDVCQSLVEANIKMFMITNQPDISRGKALAADVQNLNEAVKEKCQLTDVAMCVHDDADGCDCRKPKSGMITDLAMKHEIDLGSSVVVGDRWRDIDAGSDAGCKTLFVNYGYQESLRSTPTWEVSSMSQAGLILQEFFGLSKKEK